MYVRSSSLFFDSVCKVTGVYTAGQVCFRAERVSKKFSSARWIKSDAATRENPIPFLDNKARNFKIDDVYKVDSRSLKRQRFALPLGLGLFGVLMFLAFYGGDYEKYIQFWKIEASEPVNSGESRVQSMGQSIPEKSEKK